jgi:uncharacterized protein YlxP (DUF503 family)
LVIGILSIQLIIPASRSLKDKRHVVQSIIHKVKNNFNVSIAEMNEAASRKFSKIECVHISNDAKYTNQYLDKVYQYFDSNAYDFIITEYRISFI